MNSPGGAVDMPQITVQIGAFNFSPAPVFLYQLKKPGQLRAVLPAPCGQQDHSFIVSGLLILGCGFHHRQAKVFIKITLERRGGGIGPDLHVADQEGDFLPDGGNPFLGLCLLGFHGGPIHEQAVIPHQAAVHGGRGLDLLHNAAVPGQVLIEPAVKQVIQPQGKVAVGAGIADGFLVLRVKLVEEAPGGYGFKIRQLHMEKLRHKGFKAAVRQAPESSAAFQGKLGRRDGIIAGRLHDHPQGIQKHGLEGQIMGHLYHSGVLKYGLPQIVHDRLRLLDIPPSPVPQRDIDAAVLGYGKAHSGNGSLVGIQCGPLLRAVFLDGRGFKVKADHGGSGQIVFYLFQ